jgi:hypothetical protein
MYSLNLPKGDSIQPVNLEDIPAFVVFHQLLQTPHLVFRHRNLAGRRRLWLGIALHPTVNVEPLLSASQCSAGISKHTGPQPHLSELNMLIVVPPIATALPAPRTSHIVNAS